MNAFTHVPNILGKGEAGRALDSFDWPGTNAMILTALEEQEAVLALEGLKRFRAD